MSTREDLLDMESSCWENECETEFTERQNILENVFLALQTAPLMLMRRKYAWSDSVLTRKRQCCGETEVRENFWAYIRKLFDQVNYPFDTRGKFNQTMNNLLLIPGGCVVGKVRSKDVTNLF